jgi:hypothetical protein
VSGLGGWVARSSPIRTSTATSAKHTTANRPRRIHRIFSAGGTIAAALASRGDETIYPAVDALDATSATPDFVGLGYAYLTLPKPARPEFLPFRGFTKPTKAFLFHAVDDVRVPVENSRQAVIDIRKGRRNGRGARIRHGRPWLCPDLAARRAGGGVARSVPDLGKGAQILTRL